MIDGRYASKTRPVFMKMAAYGAPPEPWTALRTGAAALLRAERRALKG